MTDAASWGVPSFLVYTRKPFKPFTHSYQFTQQYGERVYHQARKSLIWINSIYKHFCITSRRLRMIMRPTGQNQDSVCQRWTIRWLHCLDNYARALKKFHSVVHRQIKCATKKEYSSQIHLRPHHLSPFLWEHLVWAQSHCGSPVWPLYQQAWTHAGGCRLQSKTSPNKADPSAPSLSAK